MQYTRLCIVNISLISKQHRWDNENDCWLKIATPKNIYSTIVFSTELDEYDNGQ